MTIFCPFLKQVFSSKVTTALDCLLFMSLFYSFLSPKVNWILSRLVPLWIIIIDFLLRHLIIKIPKVFLPFKYSPINSISISEWPTYTYHQKVSYPYGATFVHQENCFIRVWYFFAWTVGFFGCLAIVLEEESYHQARQQFFFS